MANAKPRLLLIDGHSQIYRAILSPTAPLSSPSGEVTSGTYVFTRMLLKLLREQSPAKVAMAIDGRRSDLERRRIFPAYKANRMRPADEKAEEIFQQVERIIQIVRLLGIPVVSSGRWEADDIIATLVRQHAKGHKTLIVTRDKDLSQLIVGDNIVCYDPITNTETTEDDVIDKWALPPKKLVVIQALMGDSTDNIPGVRGIGQSRAVALTRQYGSLKNIQKNAHRLSPAIRDAILATDLRLMRKLVKLNDHVDDMDLDDDADLSFSGLRMDAAAEVFSELGFRRLLSNPIEERKKKRSQFFEE